MIRNIRHLFWVKVRSRFARQYHIGGHELTLPPRHTLDWFRARHPRYDKPLEDISKIICDERGFVLSIDIGANIGDTAAILLKNDDSAVLCVEGNIKFIDLLQENVVRICRGAEFEFVYAGAGDGAIAALVETKDGTARVVPVGKGEAGEVLVVSLDEIVRRHARFAEAHIVKIDTDGFDADVIESGREFLRGKKPIVYFEMDPCQANSSIEKWRVTWSQLRACGYDVFNIFDNFGTHIMQITGDQVVLVDQLLRYAVSNRQLPRPSLFYYDVCAFSQENRHISNLLAMRSSCNK